MGPCSAFKPRSLTEPDKCRYWQEHDHHVPAHCSHPMGLFCNTQGRRVEWREDSDDDGYPD